MAPNRQHSGRRPANGGNAGVSPWIIANCVGWVMFKAVFWLFEAWEVRRAEYSSQREAGLQSGERAAMRYALGRGPFYDEMLLISTKKGIFL